MPLVNAKCTNCGANLQVDNTKDAAICQYCGSAYIVEKAINNYNTVNNINANIVNIYGGNSADFVIRAGVLEKYNGAATCVTIPDSVHRISNAFSYCYGLKKVKIPDTVTIIDGWAFRGCTSLEEVNIPCSVTHIGAKAFEGCTKLKNIIIPYGVIEIGIEAFCGCVGITSIDIPNSVTTISYGAFGGCKNLERVTLSQKLIKLSNRAFAGCSSLSSITIPAGTIIENLGTDYEGAFYECTNLTDVLVENNQTELPDYAFRKTPWLARRIDKRKIEQKKNWQKAGVCDLCGGSFKGLVMKKCSRCGTKKQY